MKTREISCNDTGIYRVRNSQDANIWTLIVRVPTVISVAENIDIFNFYFLKFNLFSSNDFIIHILQSDKCEE